MEDKPFQGFGPGVDLDFKLFSAEVESLKGLFEFDPIHLRRGVSDSQRYAFIGSTL